MMDPTAQYIFNYLRDVLLDSQNAVLNIEELPEGFHDLGKGLLYVGRCVLETKELAKALSRGELQGKLPAPDNEMAGPLKALHASLKHLTWQSQQVAKGDYKQRVEFMGDFAVAFNSMVEQLDLRRMALIEEIEAGRKKSQALESANDLLEAITSRLPQLVIVLDKETGEWLFTNRPMPDLLPTKLLSEELNIRLGVWVRNMKEHALREELEVTDGDTCMSFSATSYPLQWRGSNAVAFVLSDITQEKAMLRDLENAAYLDTATQVHNRHYGMRMLHEWLGGGERFAVCFVDMDNLKYVNDKFGHREGDAYIMCVVNVLREFSPDALVCRLGGDEFMILARSWSLADAEHRLEHLRGCLLHYNNGPGARYSRSISYGVVAVDETNLLPASDLLSLADEKMYTYKRAHKAQRQT